MDKYLYLNEIQKKSFVLITERILAAFISQMKDPLHHHQLRMHRTFNLNQNILKKQRSYNQNKTKQNKTSEK